MDQEPAAAAQPRYRAFISYSHRDSRFARRLHRQLEAWKLPDGTRLAPVFIDRAELAAGADLSTQVKQALDRSDALLVVASPQARASRWVDQEIALFRALHPERPVLAALIDGDPEQAFPPRLLESDGQALEPLAADFRDGQDGRRLGLIKLVAGLTDQPLDRLIQRDAHNRQRRVMAITAGALLLSLILSASLVFALRARAEAERQRAEAEGLVEFMLTDLRDRLKGVGRLDVMDAVNERAMVHYATSDPSRLPADEALRRAKLLQTMGADDLEKAGIGQPGSTIRKRAATRFAEAWRLTDASLAQEPNNPARIFAHAQSEFYLGQIAFRPWENPGPGDLEPVRKHWESYLGLAERLVHADPANDEWTRELGFAQGNLCALGLQERSQPAITRKACHGASAAMARIRARNPQSLMAGVDLANRLGWEADAALVAGAPADAIALRLQQAAIAHDLALRFPKDARALKSEMLAHLGQAKLYQALGRKAEALGALDRAAVLIASLSALDSENADWSARKQQITEMQKSLKAKH